MQNKNKEIKNEQKQYAQKTEKKIIKIKSYNSKRDGRCKINVQTNNNRNETKFSN